MRRHGTVDTRAAFEALLTEMAAELGLDALAVRQKNLLPQIPYRTMYAQNVLSYGLPECLEKVKAASGWNERKPMPGPRPRHGLLALRVGHLHAQALDRRAACHGAVAARLRRRRDALHRRRRHRPGLEHHGRAVPPPRCWTSRLDRIRVVSSDSAVTPKDNGSYSSRVTFMVGRASIAAGAGTEGAAGEGGGRAAQVVPDDIEVRDERSSSRATAGSGPRLDPGGARGDGRHWAPSRSKGTYTPARSSSRGDKKIRGSSIGATMGFCYAAQVVEEPRSTN